MMTIEREAPTAPRPDARSLLHASFTHADCLGCWVSDSPSEPSRVFLLVTLELHVFNRLVEFFTAEKDLEPDEDLEDDRINEDDDPAGGDINDEPHDDDDPAEHSLGWSENPGQGSGLLVQGVPETA